MSNRQSHHDISKKRWMGLPISMRSLAEPLSAIAFWLAIALPALYVPLIATGIEGTNGLALFFGIFSLHILSLYLGRAYLQE